METAMARKSTTDFDKWFKGVGDLEYEEVYALYHAAFSASSMGIFDVVQKDEMLFITTPICAETLVIANDKSKICFLASLTKYFCEGQGDIEFWYALKREQSKEDGNI
jgi:hypothetical protein